MLYLTYPLTDLGYQDPDTGQALASIDGRTNLPGDRFVHLGRTGYPEGSVARYESEDHTVCLALYEDGDTPPEGGTEVLAANVPALLASAYGWPGTTTLGGDGLPVAE